MAETLIISDDDDATAGFFFSACKEVIEKYFAENHIEYSNCLSKQIHHTAITAFANNKEKFIIGAFSHGNSTALTKENQEYIANDLNGAAIKGGFLYSCACGAGEVLGRQLTDNHGVLCYVGHSKKVYIWNNEHFGVFVDCATIGFIEFYNGNTTKKIIELIKDKINDEIDRMYPKNYFVAADLRKNRDSLICHGAELSLADFD